ncbi:MAG: hypothetical protein Q4G58_14775 [bacterium]|nr:hypothetical protein [bacterium]
MEQEQIRQVQVYFQTMEENIEKLPKEEQEKIYRTCAINCVKDSVLVEQRKWMKECNGDMDLMYEQHAKSEYYAYRIIERGHIYEIEYPRCLCYMKHAGFAKSEVHCECSRQSILYILNELFPEKSVKVERIQTVLGGADKCVFRIEVE